MDVSWAEERIKKHDKDLYEGNGKESITVRLDRVERFMAACLWMWRTTVGLLVTAIAAGVVDAIVRSK